jgi:hypothetical protein
MNLFHGRSTPRARGTALALALAATLAACGGEGGPRQFLSLGTGGTGGVYYPLGGALAAELSVADSARQYTAEVTGGSVENVNRIIQGQIDLAFALGVAAYEAYHGGQGFETAHPGLRVVAPLYPNVIHVLVPGDSDAESIADLRGMAVSVGSAGSGTEQTSRQLLELYGITYDDVDARYLSFNESASALRDGAIDAAIFSVGIPAAAVLEASTTGSVRLLSIPADRAAALREAYPYYSTGVIPADAYPGVEEDIPTVSMMNWLVADESLDAGVVRSVLTILSDDRAALERVHDMARQIDLSRLSEAPIPLHPAAEGFVGG